MATTSTRTQTTVGGGGSASTTKAYTGDVTEHQSYSVANSSTEERSLVIDISELLYFFIKSDQDVQLEFNATPTGVPDFALLANVPFEEFGTVADGAVSRGGYHVPLFTTDITTLHVTNASGSAANIEMIVCKNNTPA